MNRSLSCLLLLWGLLAIVSAVPSAEPQGQVPKTPKQLYQAGNYMDAYQKYRAQVLDPKTPARQVGEDLQMALDCLRQLGRQDEMDELREKAVALHEGNWRLLKVAANSLNPGESQGFIVAGEFYRGNRRGGGQYVSAWERDRVRALQLLVKAKDLAAKDKDAQPAEIASVYSDLGAKLMRRENEAWKLQSVTDLEQLPDYEPGWGYGGSNLGAPVDAEGKPIYYSVPKSFEAAASDGERWRWASMQVIELAPNRRNEVRWHMAEFFQQQFGVQTLAYLGPYFRGAPDDKPEESGTYALHTLAEDETIARLANGVRRFKLPDEFNPIKIRQQIVADPQPGYVDSALEALAGEFENRRQYPRAAEYWKQVIKQFGAGHDKYRQKRLDQIVGNWGMFEGQAAQPAGTGATIDFRFRNGKQANFEAHAINVAKLLDDVKAYLRSNPREVDWQKSQIQDIGYRLVIDKQKQYVGQRVASWSKDLEPRPQHFDARVTVETPLKQGGAYLVTARMEGGNTCQAVVWLADMAIVKKPLQGKAFYYVGNAVTGAPEAKANVEFFGYRPVWDQKTGRMARIETTNFSEFTDASGQILQPTKEQGQDYQWLVVARNGSRMAYLGFTNVWHAQYYDQQYDETKVYVITDRPVYRPGHEVKFKFWVQQAKYDQPLAVPYANKQFQMEITDAKQQKVFTQNVKSDAYGGFHGTFELPSDAALGQYSIHIPGLGGSSFRVEEYKKPEFEVTVDAPKEPVMLGEKVAATINARYYFGAPVVNAKVKYKVQRTAYTERWYPPMPWDWLYGPGYWWFAYDYPWYPGWQAWGCMRPLGWWWPQSYTPPEIVAEAELPIGPDGTLPLEIDTALAKAIHGDQDHQYEITAEVVDESRRTIVGTGRVLVARQPFKVFAWVDRGYYRAGDTVHASFSAHTLDQQPVQGKGKVDLLRVTYDAKNQPVEESVQQWDLDTDAQGLANVQITAAKAGQYRLSYKLTDAANHKIEGGYVFTVFGQGADIGSFRFNALELVADKREYAPGEKVKLLINTNREGSTVALFVRPANGTYLPPKIIKLQSKSTVTEIDVTAKDMPNFFIEAFTLSDAQFHSEMKEIVVPPEQRVLNAEVLSSAETYRPGQPAKVRVKLTDGKGKAFVGSTVLAIYDKSVEYISGGSNVGDIKSFFWKWRRQHHPQTEHTLQRWFGTLTPPGVEAMQNLGIFGGNVADELSDDKAAPDVQAPQGNMMLRSFGGGMGGGGLGGIPMPTAPMAAMAAPMEMAKSDAAPAGGEGGAGGQLAEATVRTNFADTAYWNAELETDADGTAEVALNMPESLTTWKVKLWAMGSGTRVGQAEAEVVTQKDLIVRMQAPRFFVEKDEVVLTANVHNYLESKKNVEVRLELEGGQLAAIGETTVKIEVPPDGEKRVDWRVKVVQEGQAKIRMKALGDEESDALEMSFPVYVHGMLKTEMFAGALRPADESGTLTINVPAERRINESRLEVRYSPTLAGAMVDALPYLSDYPYGCTEQTLNRFLPTVITQKILLNMGLNLKQIKEKRTNLNAQQLGDAAERAGQWNSTGFNPVFDEAEVNRMVKAGLQRLTDMQLADGGWGWFSGYREQSTPHMTAVVVHGLQIARQNDVAIVPDVLERGLAWLKRYQAEEARRLQNAAAKKSPSKPKADNLDALVYMVLADADSPNAAMLEFLYRDRVELSVYAKAMFGLALAKQKESEKLDMILQNIRQFVEQDEENQTAWLRVPEVWWYWYGSEYEAQAYYLKLLSKTDPKGELASRLAKYLVNNRTHATYWKSTRDTGLCIEALADYLKASGEDKPDLTVEVWLDGKKQKEVRIEPTELFSFDNSFVLIGDAVETGQHKLELRRKGKGPLYYNAWLTNFTLEDQITAAGLEVKVNRQYYKLVPVDKKIKAAGERGQTVDQKVEKYERQPLENMNQLTSGDLVEVELEIDSKNDYEYLVFEDMKAAGFEPVDLRSGYSGQGLGTYMELRDERVAFFVRWLARGKHSVSYRLRAEIPGQFSALPTQAHAMYAPELKANSDEIKLRIVDR